MVIGDAGVEIFSTQHENWRTGGIISIYSDGLISLSEIALNWS